MDITTAFSTINWLSVIVASLAAFAIGSIWYSPVMFSKTWQKESNLTDYDLKNASMPVIFGSAFVLMFISAVLLDMFIGPGGTAGSGLVMGLVVSLGWIVTALGVNYLFGRKSITLFLIDAGYFVVFFAAMGLILGAW
jgi:hypothetical protein